jgi:farnesyl diphosphate synthase
VLNRLEIPNHEQSFQGNFFQMIHTKRVKVDERLEFLETFDEIVSRVVADFDNFNLPQNGRDWVEKMLKETVPGGKMNRGMTVPSSLTSILNRELTPQEKTDANILGWCIELVCTFDKVAGFFPN